jgi:hypothetical protein
MQRVTRFSNVAVLGAENLLLTFTNISQQVFPDALETILDMSTALGQGLKESSIQLGKALNDPILGITALSRVGVNFTQAQKDMIKGMVEAGNVMEAQKAILAELKKEFGGSARAAAETFGGQMEQLGNTIGDVQREIGLVLLPILQEAFEDLSPIIDDLIERFLDWVQSREFEDMVEAFVEGAVEMIFWLHEELPKAISFLVGIWEKTGPTLISMWERIKNDLILAWNALVSAWIDGGEGMIIAVKAWAGFAFLSLTQLLGLMSGVLKIWGKFFKGFSLLVHGEWLRAFEVFAEIPTIAINTILRAIDSMFAVLGETFGGQVQVWFDFGKSIIFGIIDGIRSAAGALIQTVANIVGDALFAAGQLLGIGSPSKVFADEIGLPIMQGIIEGIRSGREALLDTVQLAIPAPAGGFAGAGGGTFDQRSFDNRIAQDVTIIVQGENPYQQALALEEIVKLQGRPE